MTDLRISIRNTSDSGGTALTPFWFGFHDGSFDLYNRNEAASAGLEALAEDGNNSVVGQELVAADADAQGFNVAGNRGPIAAQESASLIVDVDGASNGSVSFGSMILPSNDAFIGTGSAIELFDANGNFKGAQTVEFKGTDVLDAGTEVNTERDAAFINQTAPNTGETEGGVVTQHPGFNGSEGNPDGEQIILGGTNAFGELVDPVAADFTREGAEVAVVHINTVKTRDGTDGRDFIFGRGDDDIVNAGDGNDIVFGGGGWDVIDGGDGRDKIFGGAGYDEIKGGGDGDLLFGNKGDDIIDGGTGNDKIFGGRDDDRLVGGEGHDRILGGSGDDVIAGGEGYDRLAGGRGDDTFVFTSGDGVDKILDFGRGDDKIALAVEGVDSFEDLLEVSEQVGRTTALDFGDDGLIYLVGQKLSDLDADDFLFG